MFLKNCWYVAAWDHELVDGKLLARTLLEEAVLLYKEGDDANISRSLHQSPIEGFLEDKHLIEAQQVVIDSDPTFALQAIASDAALSHFRMTLASLLAQEEAERATQQAAARKVVKPHEIGMTA
jgi:vanillate O-demethylase monooxygenase subunit